MFIITDCLFVCTECHRTKYNEHIFFCSRIFFRCRILSITDIMVVYCKLNSSSLIYSTISAQLAISIDKETIKSGCLGNFCSGWICLFELAGSWRHMLILFPRTTLTLIVFVEILRFFLVMKIEITTWNSAKDLNC